MISVMKDGKPVYIMCYEDLSDVVDQDVLNAILQFTRDKYESELDYFKSEYESMQEDLNESERNYELYEDNIQEFCDRKRNEFENNNEINELLDELEEIGVW